MPLTNNANKPGQCCHLACCEPHQSGAGRVVRLANPKSRKQRNEDCWMVQHGLFVCDWRTAVAGAASGSAGRKIAKSPAEMIISYIESLSLCLQRCQECRAGCLAISAEKPCQPRSHAKATVHPDFRSVAISVACEERTSATVTGEVDPEDAAELAERPAGAAKLWF